MEIVLILVVVGIIVGTIAAVVYLNRKRCEELQAIAQELNLRFFPKGHESIKPYLASLDFFTFGKYPRLRNLMVGSVKNHHGTDISVAIFDYSFTIGSHRDTDTFSQTLVLFYDPSLQLPQFSLRSENILDKLANRMGFQDINFPDSPGFSKRYRLNSNAEGAVRRIFQPNLLKFFERLQGAQSINVEANASYVMIFPMGVSRINANRQEFALQGLKQQGNSRFLAPDEIKPFLETGLRLIAILNRNMNLAA